MSDQIDLPDLDPVFHVHDNDGNRRPDMEAFLRVMMRANPAIYSTARDVAVDVLTGHLLYGARIPEPAETEAVVRELLDMRGIPIPR